MKFRNSTSKVLLALLVFLPAAMIPAAGRTALLSSREAAPPDVGARNLSVLKLGEMAVSPARATRMLSSLSDEEMSRIASGTLIPLRGGESDITQSLSTNHAVAIILTLLMLGCVAGFVEASND